jgi:tetratricopeptide (TPR) repeat protein
MNSRSSISRRDKTANQGRSDETNKATMTTSSRFASRVQMRWQPRQRRVEPPHQAASASSLSQADRDILLRQQALSEAQQGNFSKAIAIFNQLIKRNPNNATDYNNRGLVYFQSGQREAALKDYNVAIDINPKLDSAYNNRANYYAAQGEFLEAILDYDTAIDLNPSNVRAWINQGITFRDLKMYERAIECFDLALCMGRLEEHIYAERGRTYHLWGDWNYAVADYQRAIVELDSGNSSSHLAHRLRLQVDSWLDNLLGISI